MYNDYFRKRMKDKLLYLAEYVFNPALIDPIVDEYEMILEEPIANEYRRYYGNNKSISEFYSSCNAIKTFFSKRYEYIMSTYGD